MNSEKFRVWLESEGKDKKTVQNRISNCKNVERYEGSLDQHFIKDYGISLLEKLSYSAKNQRQNDKPMHVVPINGNIKDGSATLKSAVNLYMNYRKAYQTIAESELNLSKNELTETEKLILTKFRIGQSIFRNKLIKYWNGCCSISSFDKVEMLISSHIKPYSECLENEKYDVYNGLLLMPNYDKLFDKFLISFDEKGKILISKSLSEFQLKLLNINKDDYIKIENNHLRYLKFHRSKFEEINNSVIKIND